MKMESYSQTVINSCSLNGLVLSTLWTGLSMIRTGYVKRQSILWTMIKEAFEANFRNKTSKEEKTLWKIKSKTLAPQLIQKVKGAR